MKKIGLVVLLLMGLYFMPFITVETKDTEGRSFRVPFGVSFKEDNQNALTFTSIRSAYALGKDAENAFHSYEDESCYGKQYYYDKENDLSFTHHEEVSGMPSSVFYYYERGNACAGWTLDDEIAWPFGKLEEVDENITTSQAIENAWFVIQDGKAMNVAAYHDFSRMIKQGVYCYQRTLIYEGNQLEKIIDIQLLESGKFLVQTKDKNGITKEEYARLSDQEKEDGSQDVEVYRSAYAGEEAIVLFTVKS